MSFWGKVEEDEQALVRSVALLAASVQVASMNISEITKGGLYTGDDTIACALRFEEYLNGKLEPAKLQLRKHS
jgi:hypothetical protein